MLSATSGNRAPVRTITRPFASAAGPAAARARLQGVHSARDLRPRGAGRTAAAASAALPRLGRRVPSLGVALPGCRVQLSGRLRGGARIDWRLVPIECRVGRVRGEVVWSWPRPWGGSSQLELGGNSDAQTSRGRRRAGLAELVCEEDGTSGPEVKSKDIYDPCCLSLVRFG